MKHNLSQRKKRFIRTLIIYQTIFFWVIFFTFSFSLGIDNLYLLHKYLMIEVMIAIIGTLFLFPIISDFVGMLVFKNWNKFFPELTDNLRKILDEKDVQTLNAKTRPSLFKFLNFVQETIALINPRGVEFSESQHLYRRSLKFTIINLFLQILVLMGFSVIIDPTGSQIGIIIIILLYSLFLVPVASFFILMAISSFSKFSYIPYKPIIFSQTKLFGLFSGIVVIFVLPINYILWEFQPALTLFFGSSAASALLAFLYLSSLILGVIIGNRVIKRFNFRKLSLLDQLWVDRYIYEKSYVWIGLFLALNIFLQLSQLFNNQFEINAIQFISMVILGTVVITSMFFGFLIERNYWSINLLLNSITKESLSKIRTITNNDDNKVIKYFGGMNLGGDIFI